jgi:hypothetical protein
VGFEALAPSSNHAVKYESECDSLSLGDVGRVGQLEREE